MRLAEFEVGNKQRIYREIWQVLEPEMCEPIDWIPVEVWKTSTSYVDLLAKSSEIDMFADFWTITQERQEQVNFSIPFIQSYRVFVVPNNQTAVDHSLWYLPIKTLSVFAVPLWMVITSLFIFMVVLARIINVLGHELNHFTAWRWATHLLGQRTWSDAYASAYVRVFMMATSLFTMHSLNLYQDCLLTSVMRETKYEIPFSTYDDVVKMIEQKQVVLNLRNPDYSFARLVLGSNQSSTVYDTLKQALQAKLQTNPPIFEGDQASDNMIPDRINGVPIVTEAADLDISRITEGRKCNMVFVVTAIGKQQALMLHPRLNQSTIDCINTAIQDNMDLISSILQHYKISQMREYWDCRHELEESQELRIGEPLKVSRLADVFVVLFFGLLASIIALFTERRGQHQGISVTKGSKDTTWTDSYTVIW